MNDKPFPVKNVSNHWERIQAVRRQGWAMSHESVNGHNGTIDALIAHSGRPSAVRLNLADAAQGGQWHGTNGQS